MAALPNDLRKLAYADPVVEVERDAYRRGHNRGVLNSILVAVLIVAILAVFS